MPHHRRSTRTARATAATAATAAVTASYLLAACGTHIASPATSAPASPSRTAASVDPATAARKAQFTQIQQQMDQAMSTAGLSAEAQVNLHPSGSLTSARYCLNSFLLLVPNNHATQVTASLQHSLQISGWTADPASSAGTVALDHGEWTITVTHQSAGSDTDPTTGKVRTRPMTFFQAKDNSLDCS